MKSFWRLPAYPAHTTKSQSQTTGLPFPARIIKRFNFQGTLSLVCFVTFVEVALPASKCQHLQALPFLYPAPPPALLDGRAAHGQQFHPGRMPAPQRLGSKEFRGCDPGAVCQLHPHLGHLIVLANPWPLSLLGHPPPGLVPSRPRSGEGNMGMRWLASQKWDVRAVFQNST